jgi:nicotinate-nucleotide--dimethylbenzimidazole phosphoribosyltransferase
MPDPNDPVDVLAILAFSTLRNAGFILGGRSAAAVIADGFISAVAALLACRICPAARKYMLFSHVSAEPADKAVLEALSAHPPIHAGMRLGEGTGAVALLPLIDMALAVYSDLMTFAEIGM